MKAIFPYDAAFEPAAPVITIGISPPGRDIATHEMLALVDSGSDVTLIPTQILIESDFRYVEQRRLRGIVGASVEVNLYLVTIHIAGLGIHGIRAVAMPDTSQAILGRDVLNQLEITLMGPAHELWVI